MNSEDTLELPVSRVKKIARGAGWVLGSLALLISFTLAKLPDDRIGTVLLSQVSQALSRSGTPVEISAGRTRISILLLGRIRFEDVTIHTLGSGSTPRTIHWNEARISPSFLDLILLRMGGSLRIVPREGTEFSGSFWFKNSSDFALSLRMNKADLGEDGVGVLPLLAGVSATLPIDGTVDLTGNLQKPATITGKIQLALGKSQLTAQKIAGFPVPAIRFDDGEIRLGIAQGKAKVESIRLGKTDRASDDIQGTMTGTITLGQSLDNSQLDLNAKLKLSAELLKSLFLIDALLGPGKLPDGSYALTMSGPVYAPQIMPASGNAQ